MDIRYLTLCLTTNCNMSCRYCYQGNIKEKQNMTAEVLTKALDLVRTGEEPFHLQLTGGEPTLVPHLIRLAVRLAKNTGRPCTIGLQTNGTGFTPDLIAFLKQTGVQPGISVDGPPNIHQQLRGSAGKMLKGLKMLEEANLPFLVTTVVSAENIDSLDRLVLMLSGFLMARGIALDLLVQKGRAETSGISLPKTDAVKHAISSMVKTLYTVNSRRSIPVSLREHDLLSKNGLSSTGSSFFCHAAAGRSVAVHPDGRLFPCSQMLGEEKFQAGTVWNPRSEELGRMKMFTLSSNDCNTCPVSDCCPGDCPSRLMFNKDFSNIACELYRTIFKHRKNT